jgi:hypothetical protein
MEQINRIGDETVITNNGKPKFSRLLPYRKPVSSLFGLHSGRLGSRGALIEPVGAWEAES